ncbi:hypothetical protein ACVXAM_002395 [Vibrio parahaemolyticus]|uniref:hypothetical protein n=1 Tax=Vibrio parahaemolyticus TaxID=670 RepID=UPI0004005A5E|nr:hypothetical protein [Vibrio parahaemolyticus]EJN3365955.1 hypothetical protein [Vibrio parahaemolyticus]EKD7366470.1 hypothetical protein [Vibrio parahaemolyticus]HAS6972763.1 hypothetical protein [Vibrio parahaemolyticus]
MKSQEELDEKLVGLVHSLEELSQAISRASAVDDIEQLAKLLERALSLKLSVRKLSE